MPSRTPSSPTRPGSARPDLRPRPWLTATVLAAAVPLAALLLARFANRRLEQDAGPVARTAESSNAAKDEFLTILAHELRNPLGAICAAVDVLESGTQGEIAAEAHAIVTRQARILSQTVNELLDVSRLLTGKAVLARQPLDLSALVGRVQRALVSNGMAQGRQLTCRLAPAWTNGDSVRLEQVVSRLASSALKSAPPSEAVVLSVRQDGPMAIVEVLHGGQAVLPDPLVRPLVELHGGTLDAESSAFGSRLVVRLPSVAPIAVTGADALPPSRRRRVLVVDDNPDSLHALRSGLERDGHTVSTAADGDDALERLLSQRPEVSIVDIGLPGLAGYAFARHARAAGYAGRMIALAADLDRDRAGALVAGFDKCLPKPVDLALLRASMLAD